MKQLIPNYTFAPGAANAGTVTFTDFTTISLARVILIIDVTTNTIIYDLSNPALGGMASTNVLTLDTNTSTLSSGDRLSIFYDVGINDPDYQDPTFSSTELATFREEFAAALNTTSVWTQTNNGMTPSISGSLLTLATGTTSGSSYLLQSKQGFTLPFRAKFVISISQRIANQSFQVGLENAAGTTLARWYWNGTTATNSTLGTTNLGTTLTADSTVTTATTASPLEFEIDARADGVDFYTRPIDSNSAATIFGTRSRTALTPGETYYITIRVNNTGAAASSTNFILDQITVQNMTKFVAEISAGRGNTSAARALPTQVLNTVTTSGTTTATLAAGTNRAGFTAASGLWFDDSTTALAASAAFTGTTRDALAVAAGTAFNSASTYAQEIRLSAASNVTGTLALEVSRDGTTFYRVKAVTTAQATGGVFYAEIIHRPSTRYFRLVYTNSTTAQTSFLAQSMVLAG